jgi:hypothetical protein
MHPDTDRYVRRQGNRIVMACGDGGLMPSSITCSTPVRLSGTVYRHKRKIPYKSIVYQMPDPDLD